MHGKIRYLVIAFLVFTTLTFAVGEKRKTLTLGVVMDGEWYQNQYVFDIFKREINDLLGNEYDVKWPAEKTAKGNWTGKSVKDALLRLLKDPEVDVVVAMGILASHQACHLENYPKPVLAPFVMDQEFQELPRKGIGSGVDNLSYIVSQHRIEEGIRDFRKLVDFDSVVFLTADFVRDSFFRIAEKMSAFTKRLNFKAETIWVGHPVDKVLEQIHPGIQAIYITPALHIGEKEFARIVEKINRLKIPSFSHLGRSDVEKGVFASALRESDFVRLARRMALNMQRILMGENAGSLQVEFKTKRELTINMKTARQIGVYPTWDIMTEAVLLHAEEAEQKDALSLMQAVNMALKSNLELLSKQTEIRAGKQDIRTAKAKLMPHIDISATDVKIDKSRAESSMGMNAENSFYGSADLTQVIYSEKAYANVTIQKRLQDSRVADLNTLTLDTALTAATSYLNVLRIRALEKVQAQNLIKTRSNLELAKVRQSLGVSGSSEVYRWQAQYARAQQQVLDAGNQRELAEIQLNRMIHVPLGKRFKITDAGLDAPFLAERFHRFYSFIDNPWIFNLFLEFIVEERLEESPELARLDAAIAASERYYKSTGRQYFMPTVALSAGVTNYFSKTGAGTEDRDMTAFFPAFSLAQVQALGSLFPSGAKDFQWQVGLNVSLPLFSGGERPAERKKANIELEQLKLNRAMVAEKLEQGIRSYIRTVGISEVKIRLSKEAAEAANKTLELVTDAYSRGAISILDVIDAQDAALGADSGAANAVYQFLIDLFNAQRSINRLDFLVEPGKQKAMLLNFDAFLTKKGIVLKKRKNMEK